VEDHGWIARQRECLWLAGAGPWAREHGFDAGEHEFFGETMRSEGASPMAIAGFGQTPVS